MAIDIKYKGIPRPGDTSIAKDRLEQLFLGGLSVGSKSVKIDGNNSRILVYDDDGVPVGLWGKHIDGF